MLIGGVCLEDLEPVVVRSYCAWNSLPCICVHLPGRCDLLCGGVIVHDVARRYDGDVVR